MEERKKRGVGLWENEMKEILYRKGRRDEFVDEDSERKEESSKEGEGE